MQCIIFNQHSAHCLLEENKEGQSTDRLPNPNAPLAQNVFVSSIDLYSLRSTLLYLVIKCACYDNDIICHISALPLSSLLLCKPICVKNLVILLRTALCVLSYAHTMHEQRFLTYKLRMCS